MSDSHHLAKWFEGPAAWNEWRASHPEVVPDLCDAIWTGGSEVTGRSAVQVDLSGVLLTRADLTDGNLSGANLISADLQEANLSDAVLTEADFRFANLVNARFDHADLSGAQLMGAFVAGAQLDLARNLTQSQIDAAYGDPTTLLPPTLMMPAAWCEPFALTADISAANGEAHDWFATDPYSVLEIERPATMVEVRAAYIRLAKRYHPDHNLGDHVAEEHFKRINHAYRLLVARDRLRRQKRRDQAPISWAAAAGLCLLALTVPGALVYWLDLPALVETSQWLGGASKTGVKNSTAPVGNTGQAEEKITVGMAEPTSNVVAKLAKEPVSKPDQPVEKSAGTEAPVSGSSPIIPVKDEQPPPPVKQDVAQEEAAWVQARRQSTITALEAYLNAYPGGRYTAEAREMVSGVKAKSAARREEQMAWLRAKTANTPQGYRDFLKAFPNGRHAGLAQRAVRSRAESLNTSTTIPGSGGALPLARPWPSWD